MDKTKKLAWTVYALATLMFSMVLGQIIIYTMLFDRFRVVESNVDRIDNVITNRRGGDQIDEPLSGESIVPKQNTVYYYIYTDGVNTPNIEVRDTPIQDGNNSGG